MICDAHRTLYSSVFYHGTDKLVTQNMLRTYEVNQTFGFVEGIWLHRQIGEILLYIFLHVCVTCSELPSNISTIVDRATIIRTKLDFFA